MTSTEAIPATSNVPVVKTECNDATRDSVKASTGTHESEYCASPRSNPTLKYSLAKPETVAPSTKTPLKSEMLTLVLPDLTPKANHLSRCRPRKCRAGSNIIDSNAIEVTTQEALMTARVGRQKLSSSQSEQGSSITPLMPEPSRIASPSEIHIQQANLLRGQQTLRKVIGEGGLDMEIFWPPTAQQSEYLYKVMTQCFGMQSAVIDDKGDLFFISGKDRESHTGFSPLLRKIMQPAGRDEVNVISEIVKMQLAGATRPYVSFFKLVDARLVNGIAQMTGNGFTRKV